MLPWCRERLPTVICYLEWLGDLIVSRVTGLDAFCRLSLPLCLSACFRTRSPRSTYRLCLQLPYQTHFQLFRQNYGIYRQIFTVVGRRQSTSTSNFPQFQFPGRRQTFFTMRDTVDITSLYTVIPVGEGLLALIQFFFFWFTHCMLSSQARIHYSALGWTGVNTKLFFIRWQLL